MDFLTLARTRHSVRQYQRRAVADGDLQRILEAGRIAPTAANRQPQRFLVVDTPEAMGRLALGADLHGAPMAILVFGDRRSVWVRPFDRKDMIDIDTAIATDHMMMEAVSLGLGTCWLTYFDPQVIRREFPVAEHLEAVHILLVGHSAVALPAEDRFAQQRRPLGDFLVHRAG